MEQLCDDVVIIRQGEIIESGSLKNLRHLTRTQFIVETMADMPGFKDLPGVYDVTKNEGKWHFQVDHEQISSVLSFLGQFNIAKLETKEPTLEDLFMRHYESDDKGGA